jgi:hypothetical protein
MSNLNIDWGKDNKLTVITTQVTETATIIMSETVIKDPSPTLEKGDLGAECNRTVCSNSSATYYNHSTQKHYCKSCAMLINLHNKADAHRMYGHDLCTLVIQQ